MLLFVFSLIGNFRNFSPKLHPCMQAARLICVHRRPVLERRNSLQKGGNFSLLPSVFVLAGPLHILHQPCTLHNCTHTRHQMQTLENCTLNTIRFLAHSVWAQTKADLESRDLRNERWLQFIRGRQQSNEMKFSQSLSFLRLLNDRKELPERQH